MWGEEFYGLYSTSFLNIPIYLLYNIRKGDVAMSLEIIRRYGPIKEDARPLPYIKGDIMKEADKILLESKNILNTNSPKMVIECVGLLLYLRNKLGPKFGRFTDKELYARKGMAVINSKEITLNDGFDHQSLDPIKEDINFIAVRCKKKFRKLDTEYESASNYEAKDKIKIKEQYLNPSMLYNEDLDEPTSTYLDYIQDTHLQSIASMKDFDDRIHTTNDPYFNLYDFTNLNSYLPDSPGLRIIKDYLSTMNTDEKKDSRYLSDHYKGYCVFSSYDYEDIHYNAKEVTKKYLQICEQLYVFLYYHAFQNKQIANIKNRQDTITSTDLASISDNQSKNLFSNMKVAYIFRNWEDVDMLIMDKFSKEMFEYNKHVLSKSNTSSSKQTEYNDAMKNKDNTDEDTEEPINEVKVIPFVDPNSQLFIQDKKFMENYNMNAMDDKEEFDKEDYLFIYLLKILNKYYGFVYRLDNFYNDYYKTKQYDNFDTKKVNALKKSIKRFLVPQLIRIGYLYFAYNMGTSMGISRKDYMDYLETKKENPMIFYKQVMKWIEKIYDEAPDYIINSILEIDLKRAKRYINYLKRTFLLSKQLKEKEVITKTSYDSIRNSNTKLNEMLNKTYDDSYYLL